MWEIPVRENYEPVYRYWKSRYTGRNNTSRRKLRPDGAPDRRSLHSGLPAPAEKQVAALWLHGPLSAAKNARDRAKSAAKTSALYARKANQ